MNIDKIKQIISKIIFEPAFLVCGRSLSWEQVLNAAEQKTKVLNEEEIFDLERAFHEADLDGVSLYPLTAI